MPARRRIISLATGLGLVGSALLLVPVGATANPAGTGLVISEIYGNGGSNATAAFRSDFIELYNPTASPIELTGLSLQHRTATSSTSTGIVPLNGTVPAGSPLPGQGRRRRRPHQARAADPRRRLDPDPGQPGQVLLVDGVDPFVGTGNLAGSPGLVDMVGYGVDAISFEGATRAPAHGGATSTAREPVGADTDKNGPDFVDRDPADAGGLWLPQLRRRRAPHRRDPGHWRDHPRARVPGHHHRRRDRRLPAGRPQRVLHADPRARRHPECL